MPKLRRVYQVDENGDVIGSTPLGPLAEPIWITESTWDRVYLRVPPKGDASYVDIFSDSAKNPIIRHHFCEDATSQEMEAFEKRVKQTEFVDQATDRWGELTIQWAGPDAPHDKVRAIATLEIYYDGDMQFAYLDHRPQVIPTYEKVLEDFEILRQYFESVRSA